MAVEHSIKGIVTVAFAGLSSGSFPVPSKRIVSKRWEHIWFAYSIFAMGFLPLGVAFMLSRGVVPKLLLQNPALSLKVATFGALWGLGSLLFGVSLARIGMAVTNAMVNGVVILLGSIGPIIMGAVSLNSREMMWLIGGLSVLVTSLLLSALASIFRDRTEATIMMSSVFRTRSIMAVLIAIAAGVLSSMLNIGFVVGAPLSDRARTLGCPALIAGISIWVPILLGGLVFNVGYPAFLIFKKHSWSVFFCGPETGSYWLRTLLMSALWFGAILIYGAGTLILGRSGTVYGWAMFAAITILTSNVWGVFTGEWKGAGRKPQVLMWISALLFVTSLLILAEQQGSV